MTTRHDCTDCCWHEMAYQFVEGEYLFDCICWSEAEAYGWHTACCRFCREGTTDARKCPWHEGVEDAVERDNL